MPIDVKVTKRTETTHEVRLGREELSKLSGLNLPDAASIFVHVPGGGDWSNTILPIDAHTPIIIRWQTTSED